MKYKVLILLLFFKAIIIEAQFAPFSEGQRYHAPDLFNKPDVSSLGTYGNLEVNMAEGKPNINLNIYSLSIDQQNSYNISLNYDTSANKPENIPSWTGLGWNLNSSGSITRSLKGEVDEFDGNSYYFNPGAFLGAGDWDSYGKMQNYVGNSKHIERVATPDIFYFSVDHLQGSFFKNHEGKWIINCNEQDVTISDVLKNNDLGMQSFIYSFIITDNKGNVYTFGGSPESIERYRLRKKYILDAEYYDYVKNWHITSIKYNSDKKINFTYNQAGRIFNKQSYANYKRHSFKNWIGFTGCASNIDQHNCFSLAAFEEGDVSYLSKITFDSGEIIFNRSIANSLEFKNYGATMDRKDIKPDNNYYNSRHKYKLDNIIVNYKNVNVDKITFGYDENPSRRLKLQTLSIGRDPSTAKKYRFEYNSNLFPDFNSNNIDHWGYFNNRSFNSYSVDVQNFGQVADVYSQSREPNFQLNEILEKVVYPTSGYSKFIYEPHTYSKTIDYNNGFNVVNTSNNTTGGFRIKEIIDFDGSMEKKKQYFYVNDYFGGNNQSSGTVSKIQSYTSGNVIMQELSSSNAFNTTNNSHIVYSKVYEKLSNGGVTEYTFTNQDNGYMDLKASNFLTGCTFRLGFAGPPPSSSISWGGSNTEYYNPPSTLYKEYNSLENERAKILSKIEYDSSGKKLTKRTYEYSTDPQRFEKYGRFLSLEIGDYGIYSEVAPAGIPAADQRYLTSLAKVSAYRVFFYNHYLKSETSTVYSGNNEATTLKNYFYNGNFHGQLTSEETTLPDNTKNKTTFQYASDLRHGNQPQQNMPPFFSLPHMILNNMVGIPLITTSYKNNTFQQRNQITYDVSYPASNVYLVLPKKSLLYTEDKMTPSPSNGFPSIMLPSPAFAYTEASYDRYDNKGNLLQYTLKDNIPVTIIWGYGQTQPIAKIEGITYSELAAKLNFQDTNSGYTALPVVISSDSDTSASYEKQTFIPELDNFRKNPALKDYQISMYSHDPLVGITSITSPSGIREYFIYDSANKLQRIVDSNDKIIKEYQYNFAPTIYYSVEKSLGFTRNNCGPGTEPLVPVIYTVPANKYTSLISQADADQKAQNDLTANGQNNANTLGICQAYVCTITPSFNAQIYYSSFQENTANHINAILSFPTSSSGSNTPNWSGGVMIGTLGVKCRPSSYKSITATSGGTSWSISIGPAGDVTVRSLGSGSTSSVSLYFEYDKN